MGFARDSDGSTLLARHVMGAEAADLPLLMRRLAPWRPASDFTELNECVVGRLTGERDRSLLATVGLADQLYVLGEGFAFDFTVLAAGKRHIFDFYGPGAICNWTRPDREDRPENLMIKARSEVFVLDRARLDEVLARREDLAGAIQDHEVRRAMRISQRVRALISQPAKECLRSLLLDFEDEYRLTEPDATWLPMPFTQEEVGDIIGATSVHVSRTMAALEKNGEVERHGALFRLPDSAASRRQMAYRSFLDPIP